VSKGKLAYDRRTDEAPGTVYHRLTVVRTTTSATGQKMLHCTCACGGTIVASRSNVRLGKTRSCGCYRREQIQHANTRHGQAKTGVYRVWAGMIRRCHNPTAEGYAFYGARGVVVCDEWRRDFAVFFAEVGPRPSPQHSLDRWPNPHGNYEPGNVRWATLAEQRRNWRNNRFIEWQGRQQLLTDWCRELGLPFSATRMRLRNGWGVERAFTEPLKSHARCAPPTGVSSRSSSPSRSRG
jgi:hypothetical protein